MKRTKPQHQGSLYDQLRELYDLAVKDGLYDAADFVMAKIREIDYVNEKVEAIRKSLAK